MNTFFHKLLQYIALATAIYLVFRFVPNNNIPHTDSLLITSIIVLVFILTETLCGSFANKLSTDEQFAMCSSVCSSNKEHMESVAEVKMPEVKMADPSGSCTSGTCSPQPEVPEQKPAQPTQPTHSTETDSVISHGMPATTPEPDKDVISNEMIYSDYNHVPIGDGYDTGNFEYGYSFLPPEKWYPQPPFPPVCVTQNKCPVCPIYTTGAPVDVKEWNSSRRVMPPDNINVKYITEKLNSGK